MSNNNIEKIWINTLENDFSGVSFTRNSNFTLHNDEITKNRYGENCKIKSLSIEDNDDKTIVTIIKQKDPRYIKYNNIFDALFDLDNEGNIYNIYYQPHNGSAYYLVKYNINYDIFELFNSDGEEADVTFDINYGSFYYNEEDFKDD